MAGRPQQPVGRPGELACSLAQGWGGREKRKRASACCGGTCVFACFHRGDGPPYRSP